MAKPVAGSLREVSPLRSRAARLLVAGLACVAFAGGCGAGETASRQPATTAVATEAPQASSPPSRPPADANGGENTAAAESRPEILLLEGDQLDGTQFDFAATAGNDVLLWFWAPW